MATKKATKSNARKSVKGKTSKTKTAKTSSSRFAGDAKFVWTAKENPCRPGTTQHKRMEKLRSLSGKTYDDVRAKGGDALAIRRAVADGLAKVG